MESQITRQTRSTGPAKQQGYAMVLLLAFIALAVPLAIAVLSMSAQLNRNSRVFDDVLKKQYSNNGGLEQAISQLLNNPTFDQGLTPGSPTKESAITVNNQSVTVRITKIYSGSPMAGQGLRVTKTVTPTTATPNVLTTYTYTISIENIGSGTDEIMQVQDVLPRGFSYQTGTTSGITTSNPSINTESESMDAQTLWLNNSASNPRPWSSTQGTASSEASITPAQSTWTYVPEYWEIPLVAGQTAANQWEQFQWWQGTTSGNQQWRWILQRVNGANVTTIFTSATQSLDNSGQWKERNDNENPGIITANAGDSLRLRLQVYSTNSSSSARLFKFRWGGAANYNSRTSMPRFSQTNCNGSAQDLTWSISPNRSLAAGEIATLTFQATATKSDGTYLNTASAEYHPWWNLGDTLTQYSSPTAPITIGTGVPSCGGGITVNKTADPPQGPVGVPTTFTYTISIQNQTPFGVAINRIYDLLPPGFTYVTGSSSGFWPVAPESVLFDQDRQRWLINWHPDGNVEVPANSTVAQIFQATATPLQGMDYFNDAWVTWDEDSCLSCPPDSGGSYTGSSGRVLEPKLYDIQVISGTGEILSRVQLSSLLDSITILSYQQK